MPAIRPSLQSDRGAIHDGADSAAERLTKRVGVPLFIVTTFASAFLIFLVQPLVGKRIVPWFGGVPSVWSLCLAFYQTTLFAGYAYAHLLIRRASPGLQLAVHAGVVAAALLALPVLPSDSWKPEGSGDPSAQIVMMLLANVALPFLALAATGPLVAVWFSRRYSERSPYPLYAVSNFGSLVALLAYPFVLEPSLPLSTTGQLWSGAFVATGAAVLGCAASAWRAGDSSAVTPDGGAVASDLRLSRVVLWILLAAAAVVLLMGVTNELCLDIASVPFLWILPLTLYLVSLILCFGAAPVYRRAPFAALAALAFLEPTLASRWGIHDALVAAAGGAVPFQIVRFGTLLFAACMALHGELYRLRPPARSLSAFYLCTSGGGALGGLAVGLVAPRVFDDFYELTFGVALSCLLWIAACRDDERGWLGRSAPLWHWAPAVAIAGALLCYTGSQPFERPAAVVHQERSFFGVVRVEERPQWGMRMWTLLHGSTLHGFQVDGRKDEPTSYYSIHTGIGIALGLRAPDVPSEIGVVGLGTGTLAAYGRPGDHIRYFEIDPAVIRLAHDPRFFTYLTNSAADVEIILGDGRISLARERARNAPRFDYLIVDAYSSDSVPVHLLTREALALYLDVLKPDGLLAIHISTRFFDLMPLLSRLSADLGLHAVTLSSGFMARRLTSESNWFLVCRDEQRIETLIEAANERHRALGLPPTMQVVRRPTPEMIARAPLWTDDYSDLVRALK